MIGKSGMPLKASLAILLLLFQGLGGKPAIQIIESGTLVLIGFTADATILVADSAAVAGRKIIRRDAKKIIQVGNFGAALIAGANRMSSSSGEHIDIASLVTQCAKENADIR